MTTKLSEQSNPNDETMNDPKDGRSFGYRIVVSGMSGLFPNSHNVKDLSQILYNKINPATKTNWGLNHPEYTQYKGNIPDLEYFDAQFFKVHYRLGINMDPVSRKILEQAYQAIYDAGVNPKSLSGKKIGVFIGATDSETEKFLFYTNTTTGLVITGCSRTMFANRISYWLNAKGPSLSIDAACCSSTAAIEMAYLAIKRGDCEAAIVGGGSICLHPHTSFNYGRIVNMNMDGKTKSFDKNAAGCTPSEAINVLFLQKAEDALRIYGEVVHAKCEFISKLNTDIGPKHGFYRNPNDSINFLNTFYKEVNVSPQVVQYVEAFGSATPEADKSELETIDKVFCKTRNKPLLVGSVMSNIGYTRSVTGIPAVTKVLLGYHYGTLAANLHYESSPEDFSAIKEGRIEILKEHAGFDRTYTAVNSLSITGVNAHILLHGHYKPKDINRYKANIPRIVLLSGRLESSVKKIIEDLKSRSIDPEEHALLHNIHEMRIPGHLGRGYVILDTNDKNETVSLREHSEYFDQGERPLWFVYSGMGSQWVGMGKELMRIPIFAAAIERCHRILEPKGINIVDIITSDDKKTFDNVLHSFVGIAAIQIGLTDVLSELDIHPDKVIGHSLGEIGCAYADGCFNVEETILCAYSRGLVAISTPLIRGSMAAVGLGYKKISKLCPPEIEVACHNSSESSTISGPAEIMSEFVASLVSQGIFAKEVQCSNMAFHSRYIADIGPPMAKYMNEIITSPKLRSERWVSTSVPQNRWDEPSAKYSSAEYHTNNVLKPVLFEEILNLIPSDAVLIEIAPHGLLQAILKRSLSETCRLIPLTQRGHPNSTLFLLEAIGRLSIEGFNPKVKALYPKVEFPVSTETPMLSHLVDWAYHEKWDLYSYVGSNTKTPAVSKFLVCTYDKEHTYLKGHVIRGKNVYPYAAALVSVWDTLAMCLNVKPKCLSVEFRDLYLHSQPVLHEQRQLRIIVSLQRGTGQFEVRNENSLMLKGTIARNITTTREVPSRHDNHTSVCAQEIYQLFHARDYNYMSECCSLYSLNETLTEGKIEWTNNWVTFIDGILQLNMLRRKHNSVSKLSFIRKLVIDVDKQFTCESIKNNDAALLKAHVLEELERTVCGGVMIESPRFVDLPVLKDNRIALKTLKLVPKNIKTKHEDYMSLKEEVDLKTKEILKLIKTDDSRSLNWIKAVQNNCIGVDVKVNYAGINIVYANRLLGINLMKNNDLNKNLIEFSGITKSGARVMGIVKSDTITSSLTANSELLWPVPAHWSLEDAATVPLAYSMAFYILFIRSQLRPHHVVCVNGGGAGALGQAVITIALAHGCEVFASVGNNDKKKLLLKLFPQLKDDHIGYSRDFRFVDMVRTTTKRKGCDIVISTVKGELKNVSTKCLGYYGIFFDMTVIQTGEDYKLDMSCFDGQTTFITVDFTSVLEQKYLPNAKKLQTMLSEGITRGYVRPLTRITFAPKDANRAFYLQATQCNRGRVLLDLQEIESAVRLRLACSNSSWQLLISDNEILTLKLAEKLIKQGAKKLVLLLNNPSKCVHIQSRFWRKDGIEIKLIHENIWNESNFFEVIRNCKLGSGLESVFIIISKEKSSNMTEIEQKLTEIINKSCTSLKYFALVSTGNIDTVQTSVTGIMDKQNMTTKILLPEIDMIHSKELIRKNKFALTINNAVDVLEELLCLKQSTVKVQMNAAPRQSLLQQLLNLADIRERAENGTINKKLGELNIDSIKLLEIQIYLRDVYDVCLTIEEIKLLSKESINELEKQCMEYNFIASEGISSYFCNTDNDELLSSTEIVYLSTLLNGEMCVDEIDASKTHLNIIPGVEGLYSHFLVMCERIKIPTLVLQPGLDSTNETVSELAKRYVNILLQKCNIKNNFYLLGYESGVWVALEMAAILEEKGLTGTVYCLGGSPAEILTHFKQNLSMYKTEEQLQMAVLKHLYSLMTNEDTDLLDNICNNKTWDEKVNACVCALRGKALHTMQYAKKFIETAYARLTAVLQYTAEPKILQSRLISLRPQYSTSMDLTLQKYSHQKIITYQLQAPLSLATEDLMCASIINQHFDSNIIEGLTK